MGATTMEATTVYARPARNTRILLWIIQGVLASLFTILAGQGAGALVPLAVGALAAFVAYARWESAKSR
jgi:hypothetical protein